MTSEKKALAGPLPLDDTWPEQKFGLIEWIIQENKIILCPYLSEVIALKTKDINQTFTEWTGLDHPDDVAAINNLRAGVLSGQITYILYESRKMCRDGKWRWFRVRGKIIEVDSSGKPLRSITICTEITKSKEQEASRSELDKMLSFFIKQVPVPVAMFDTNMCYKFISEEWNKAFGKEKIHGFIGQSHYDIFPDTPEVWRKRHQAAMQGKVQVYLDEKLTHASEKPIWVEGTMHPWYALDGSIGGIFVYSKIVTERVVAEKKLKGIVENLSRSNQALERFAHVCSHDLKGPLRSVSNFIHLLFNASSEHFTEESMLYMRYILKGIARMDMLIKDILEYSKIVGQYSCERIPLDMNIIVQKIKDTFEYRFLELGARLEIGQLPTILGEPTQINQLFTNLISNSIKFRSDKSLIIDVFAIERDLSWEFHIRDNGIGIEKEYHKSIFTMFKRLHSKNQYEGSGIGLAICQKIVHEHLGEIHVESPPEGGSEFIFTFLKIKI
jgi:signal transduction histidine kinase